MVINLNAAAIAAINSTHGPISFGISLNADTTQNDSIFGNTGTYNGVPSLVLTTGPVPEPSTWVSLVTGGIGLALSISRRHSRTQFAA